MRAYLDAGFLLALLINSTKDGPVANQLVRDLEGPFPVNFLGEGRGARGGNSSSPGFALSGECDLRFQI